MGEDSFFHQPLSMDWLIDEFSFKYGILLYMIEEVKLSISVLILYRFMLCIFFYKDVLDLIRNLPPSDFIKVKVFHVFLSVQIRNHNFNFEKLIIKSL